uniref:Uncharacterized protein n=1 Tax=Rhabditophanes sp. KR3021 TaxID=114890 RepID=A0AC35TIJ4_9BILA
MTVDANTTVKPGCEDGSKGWGFIIALVISLALIGGSVFYCWCKTKQPVNKKDPFTATEVKDEKNKKSKKTKKTKPGNSHWTKDVTLDHLGQREKGKSPKTDKSVTKHNVSSIIPSSIDNAVTSQVLPLVYIKEIDKAKIEGNTVTLANGPSLVAGRGSGDCLPTLADVKEDEKPKVQENTQKITKNKPNVVVDGKKSVLKSPAEEVYFSCSSDFVDDSVGSSVDSSIPLNDDEFMRLVVPPMHTEIITKSSAFKKNVGTKKAGKLTGRSYYESTSKSTAPSIPKLHKKKAPAKAAVPQSSYIKQLLEKDKMEETSGNSKISLNEVSKTSLAEGSKDIAAAPQTFLPGYRGFGENNYDVENQGSYYGDNKSNVTNQGNAFNQTFIQVTSECPARQDSFFATNAQNTHHQVRRNIFSKSSQSIYGASFFGPAKVMPPPLLNIATLPGLRHKPLKMSQNSHAKKIVVKNAIPYVVRQTIMQTRQNNGDRFEVIDDMHSSTTYISKFV